MTPVYDANVRLVAFFDGTCLFDLAGEWIAFHDRGHVFATSGRWLGPLQDGTFLDLDGKAVAWLAGSRPTTGMKPARPMHPKRPLPPKRPLQPRAPLPPPMPLQPGGGWSGLTWSQWRGHEPVVADAPLDVAGADIEVTPDTGTASGGSTR